MGDFLFLALHHAVDTSAHALNATLQCVRAETGTYIPERALVSLSDSLLDQFDQRLNVVEFRFFEHAFFHQIVLEDQLAMTKVAEVEALVHQCNDRESLT